MSFPAVTVGAGLVGKFCRSSHTFSPWLFAKPYNAVRYLHYNIAGVCVCRTGKQKMPPSHGTGSSGTQSLTKTCLDCATTSKRISENFLDSQLSMKTARSMNFSVRFPQSNGNPPALDIILQSC